MRKIEQETASEFSVLRVCQKEIQHEVHGRFGLLAGSGHTGVRTIWREARGACYAISGEQMIDFGSLMGCSTVNYEIGSQIRAQGAFQGVNGEVSWPSSR